MDLLADLTPAQREAVTHVDGPLLVLAGAGSGKTRVITRRVAHLLSQGIAGENILALTFTNKAAGEMRERIEALAPSRGSGSAPSTASAPACCARYAPLVGLDRGFTIYDQADRLRAVKDVDGAARPRRRRRSRPSGSTPPSAGPRTTWSSPAKSCAWQGDDDHVASSPRSTRPTRSGSASRRPSTSTTCSSTSSRSCKEHTDVRAELDARFRYVLVDEYQDTNLAQYAIVRGTLGRPAEPLRDRRPRPVDLRLARGEPQQHPRIRARLSRLQGRASSSGITAAPRTSSSVADHLIRHNRNRKPKALTTENPDGPAGRADHLRRPRPTRPGASPARSSSSVREGEYGYRRRRRLLPGDGPDPRTSSRRSAAAKIPYQVVGGVSFYERQEIKDVLAYLNLMANPKDDVAFGRVVNVPPRGLGQDVARAPDRPTPAAWACRCWRWPGEAASVPGLKDKAAAGLRDFAMLMDELTALRDHAAEEVIRRLLTLSGYHELPRADDQGRGRGPAGERRRAGLGRPRVRPRAPGRLGRRFPGGDQPAPRPSTAGRTTRARSR